MISASNPAAYFSTPATTSERQFFIIYIERGAFISSLTQLTTNKFFITVDLLPLL
jgi:hypothetical protein